MNDLMTKYCPQAAVYGGPYWIAWSRTNGYCGWGRNKKDAIDDHLEKMSKGEL
jgi:hypothetical protein